MATCHWCRGWSSPKELVSLVGGTHGGLYPPISGTPSPPAEGNWGPAQRRPNLTYTKHPILQPTQVMALQLRTEERITLLRQGPRGTPSSVDISYSFQDEDRRSENIPATPAIHFSLLMQSNLPPPSPTSFHPFILVLTAGILYRSIFWCFEHVPNLLDLSCAVAAISQPGRHSAGGIQQHSKGAGGAKTVAHFSGLRFRDNSHLQRRVYRRISHQQHSQLLIFLPSSHTLRLPSISGKARPL